MTTVDLIQRFLDYVGDPNQDVWDSTRVTRYLNTAKDEVANVIETNCDQAYFVDTQDLGITPTSTSAALTTGVRNILLVRRTDGDIDQEATIIDFRRANLYVGLGAADPSFPSSITCFLKGADIHFLNVDEDMSFAVDYAYAPLDLDSTNTSLDPNIPPQHQNVVVLTAARDAILSESGEDVGRFDRRLNDARQSMITDMQTRVRDDAVYVNYIPS
jgi:hypothetical protein